MNPVDISNKIKDILNEVFHSELADPESALLEKFYQLTYDAVKVERERCRVIALRAYLNTDPKETQRFLDGAIENGERIARLIDPYVPDWMNFSR